MVPPVTAWAISWMTDAAWASGGNVKKIGQNTNRLPFT